MGQITSVTADPTTVAPGGTSRITPTVVANPGIDETATVTIQLDGESGTAPVHLHSDAEAITYSVNAADIGKPGVVVATTDRGSLSLNPDNTFTLQL